MSGERFPDDFEPASDDVVSFKGAPIEGLSWFELYVALCDCNRERVRLRDFEHTREAIYGRREARR